MIPKAEDLIFVGRSSEVKTEKRANPDETVIFPKVMNTKRSRDEETGMSEVKNRETPQLEK